MSRTLTAVLPSLLVFALVLGIMWRVNRRGSDQLVGAASRRMLRLIASAQPHCDEKVMAAVTCNHDGRPLLVSLPATVKQAAEEMGLGLAADDLSSPILLAVSDRWVYALHCVPTLLGAKTRREIQRWSKDELEVFVDSKCSVSYLVLGTRTGLSRVFEVGSLHVGPARLFNAFTEALGVSDARKELSGR